MLFFNIIRYYVSKKTTSLPYNEVKSMLQISCNLNSFSKY